MTAVSSVSSTLASATDTTTQAVKDNYDLSSQQFLELMVAKLSNQDPLNPTDDSEFLGQLAQMQGLSQQIKSTEAITAMTEEVSNMTAEMANLRFTSQFQSASGLIGTYVCGTDADGNAVEGLASSVVLDDNEVYIKLYDGTQIAFDNIQEAAMAYYDDGSES